MSKAWIGIEWCLRELGAYAAQNPGTPLTIIYRTILAALDKAQGEVERLREIISVAQDYRNAETDPEVNSVDTHKCAMRLDKALKAASHTDGLSGYTDDSESALLMVSDQRNKAGSAKKECEHELASLRHTLDELVGIQRERAESAEARVKVLEEALRFYAEDDAKSVEAGIQAYIGDRPATAALAVLEESI